MIEIKRLEGTEEVSYTIYTKAEAKSNGLKFKDWQNCVEGEWGLTTDGYVTRCLGIKILSYQSYRAKRRRPNIIMFEGGSEFTDSKAFNFIDKKRSGNYDKPCQLDPAESFLSDPVVKNVIQFAIFQKATQGYISDTDLAKLMSPYASGNTLEEIKAILRKRETREVLKDETRDILAKRGITEEVIIDKYLSIEQRARETDKLETEMKVIDKFAYLIGMTDKKRDIGELLPSQEVQQANVIENKVAKQLEEAKRIEGMGEDA